MRGKDLIAQDVSTNGSGIRPGGSMEESERLPLIQQKSRVIGESDIVELYPGVQVGRVGTWTAGGVPNPTSVMAEAPTMAMRLVDRP